MNIAEYIKEGSRLVIEDKNIIDWYDGEVQALIKLRNIRPWMCCLLLAWDMDINEKIYGLFPIDESAVDTIVSLLEDSKDKNKTEHAWESIVRSISAIVSINSERIHIIMCKNLDSEIEKVKLIVPDAISKHMAMEIDDIVDNGNIGFWFHVINN